MAERVRLRGVEPGDVPIFFAQQLDSTANHMAAFTAQDPADCEAFEQHWKRLLGDQSIEKRTVLFEDDVAGYMASFERMEKREICYWLGREYWGKGVATCALSAFLSELTVRPLFARVAVDNSASVRVLTKCGFNICGSDKGFSNSRGEEVEEHIMELTQTPESEECF